MDLLFQWASVTNLGHRHVRAGMLEISRKIQYIHSFSNFPLMSFEDCSILGIKVRQGPGNSGPDQFHGNPEHTQCQGSQLLVRAQSRYSAQPSLVRVGNVMVTPDSSPWPMVRLTREFLPSVPSDAGNLLVLGPLSPRQQTVIRADMKLSLCQMQPLFGTNYAYDRVINVK